MYHVFETETILEQIDKTYSPATLVSYSVVRQIGQRFTQRISQFLQKGHAQLNHLNQIYVVNYHIF